MDLGTEALGPAMSRALNNEGDLSLLIPAFCKFTISGGGGTLDRGLGLWIQSGVQVKVFR